jgi:hypothetical protein
VRGIHRRVELPAPLWPDTGGSEGIGRMSDQADHQEEHVPIKRGEPVWKEAMERIAERNEQARKAGKQRREASQRQRDEARRVADQRRMAGLLARRRTP